jgi:Protein of unknown function (DUF3662)/FHA domain
MPILREFERRLEGLVEGFFTKAFRSGVHPIELAKRLVREMDANQTLGVSTVWVPNHYAFVLSPDDRAKFGQMEGAIGSELRQLAVSEARERGWKLVGPAEVEFETDEGLGKGEFVCRATLVEGPDKPLTGEMQALGNVEPGSGGELVLIEHNRPVRTYVLNKPLVALGRLSECEIVVADPGASRRHAEIRRENGRFVLTDLGSTNGTQVNEATVSERALEQGDRITIGHTVLEFRRR